MAIENNNLDTKFERNSKGVVKNWIWVVIFAIAFAWVESAVVVHLREIFFDGG